MQIDIKSSLLSHFVDINLFLFHINTFSKYLVPIHLRYKHHDEI